MNAPHIPKPVGPYSPARVHSQIVYTSGQIAMQADGQVVTESISAETAQALRNVQAVLEANAASMASVFSVIVYLTDMADFAAMNQVYTEFFAEPYPARTCVAVVGLPKGARVEIAATACKIMIWDVVA